MIDITKQYKTPEGREVRIYATDAGTERPVHGAIKYDDGWFPRSWTAKGTTFSDGGHCSDDLIEVKPRIKREVWVNVWRDDTDGELWLTKAEANRAGANSRIACIKIVIDCEEGEGL
jgi:hypothetical protein